MFGAVIGNKEGHSMRRGFWLAMAAISLWLGGCSSFATQSDADFWSKNNTTSFTEP
jgi:hypothetical protein